MRNLSPPDDPLSAIYYRLIPLVTNNLDWWRESVRRWAGTKKPLPIPLPELPSPDEKVVLLAAIYDRYAAPAGQIDPWRYPLNIPAEAMADDWTGPIPGTEGYIQALAEGLATYHGLIECVPLLREHWDSHKAAVELFISEVAKSLKAIGTGSQATADAPPKAEGSTPGAGVNPPHSQTSMKWQEAAERMERLWRRGEPFTSQMTLAEQIGCSKSTINRAIRKTQSLRKWAKRDAIPNAQSVNETVLDNKAQEQESLPEDEAAIREYLERENLTPEERAFFNGLSREGQLDFLNDPDACDGILHARILSRKP